MNFAELLATANQSKTGRGPSQWAPAACRVWREAELEMARLLEAGEHKIPWGAGEWPALRKAGRLEFFSH
jgi:hypothetical protein